MEIYLDGTEKEAVMAEVGRFISSELVMSKIKLEIKKAFDNMRIDIQQLVREEVKAQLVAMNRETNKEWEEAIDRQDKSLEQPEPENVAQENTNGV